VISLFIRLVSFIRELFRGPNPPGLEFLSLPSGVAVPQFVPKESVFSQDSRDTRKADPPLEGEPLSSQPQPEDNSQTESVLSPDTGGSTTNSPDTTNSLGPQTDLPEEHLKEGPPQEKEGLFKQIPEDLSLSTPPLSEGQTLPDQEKQFRLVKYFSSVSILVIFASCLVLAVLMTREAEDIIYERVVEDTIMIMDNLNYQMYNHFLLPIYREKGQAKLSEPEAYKFLDEVIENTVYGFDISRVAIYDDKYGMQVYSSDSDVPVVNYFPSVVSGEIIPLGNLAEPLSPYLEAISLAFLPAPPFDNVIRDGGFIVRQSWRGPGESGRIEYLNYLKKRTVIVKEEGSFLVGEFFPRGQFAIRCFKAMEDYNSFNISGVLEITRDLTPEYRQIAAMQYVALAIAVGTTIFLSFALRLVVARGEAIIHQRNAEKAALNEKLNEAERLVNLGRMVSIVSHEIRNPLGIINSSAEFLRDRLKEEIPGLSRLSAAIVDECARLSRIVTDFLDFARPLEPRFTRVFVEEILEEIFVFLEIDMARVGVELKTNLRENPGPIVADGILLYRAFLNILVNAIQAMPDGGLLTVTTYLEDEKFQGGPKDLGHLSVEIVDTGPGIKLEVFSNLFKPFYTTKIKGTGLGLVLVRNIVESHSGKLELNNVATTESDDEHGLKVTISLPLSQKNQ
jgi:signal transduction histidine kinase